MVENNEIENNSSMGSGQTPEFPELDNNLLAEDLGQETSANATDLEETQENPVGDGQAPVPAKKTKKTGRRWVWASILAMLVLLIAGVIWGYRAGIQKRLDKQNSAVMDRIAQQLALAYDDINAQNYENAKVRVEYIIELYPGFPGAEEMLSDIMLHLEAPTPVPTVVTVETPIPVATATPDTRGEEETFAQIRQQILDQDWEGAIQNIMSMKENHYEYKTVELDGFYFIALRNRGMQLVYAGQLEQGIYNLTVADNLGALDGEADGVRNWASMYLTGASFWDSNWASAVEIFGDLATQLPYLSDSSGMTSTERYRIALYRLGDQFAANGDYCTAADYYQQSLAIGGNPDIQATATAYAEACAGPQETLTPPLETPGTGVTPTPTTEVTTTP